LAVIKEKKIVIDWGDLGPKLITNLIEKNNVINNVLSKEFFYPIHYTEAMKALDPAFNEEIEKVTKNSFVYHYWNENFKRNEVDKFEKPEQGSYLSNLFFDKL
jgi:hypothetical protein